MVTTNFRVSPPHVLRGRARPLGPSLRTLTHRPHAAPGDLFSLAYLPPRDGLTSQVSRAVEGSSPGFSIRSRGNPPMRAGKAVRMGQRATRRAHLPESPCA